MLTSLETSQVPTCIHWAAIGSSGCPYQYKEPRSSRSFLFPTMYAGPMRMTLMRWLPHLVLLLALLSANAVEAERITQMVQDILNMPQPDCVREGPPCGRDPDR